jgi:hypothetical protein
MADPTTVTCPECLAPAGHPCQTFGDDAHADRRRLADLRSLEHGTCALCTQVRGSVDGAPVTAWHFMPEHVAACPPMPDPGTDWNAYALAVQDGLVPGRPGLEHFIPDPVEATP